MVAATQIPMFLDKRTCLSHVGEDTQFDLLQTLSMRNDECRPFDQSGL